MNECEKQTDNCSYMCVNEIGSFICTCPMGYKLAADKANCEGTYTQSVSSYCICYNVQISMSVLKVHLAVATNVKMLMEATVATALILITTHWTLTTGHAWVRIY